MNSSKLIDIFKDGNIVIPIFFLKNYKEFKLSYEEFIFLMYLYNLGNKFLFDTNKFSSDLNLNVKEVMMNISNLTDKGFIKVEVLKNDKDIMEEVVVLDDFYQKLTSFTIDKVNNTKSDDSTVFELIEKEFGRTLSPIEIEIIRAWLDNNINEVLIKEALKEATFNGVSNLRYIDKILYEWKKKGIESVEDVEKNRKERNKSKEKESNEDISEIVDWDWFDEDE